METLQAFRQQTSGSVELFFVLVLCVQSIVLLPEVSTEVAQVVKVIPFRFVLNRKHRSWGYFPPSEIFFEKKPFVLLRKKAEFWTGFVQKKLPTFHRGVKLVQREGGKHYHTHLSDGIVRRECSCLLIVLGLTAERALANHT